MRRRTLLASALLAAATACASAPEPTPAPSAGRTVARVSATAEANAARGLPPCVKGAQFEGIATPGEGELRVQLYHPSIGIERHNNKRFDLLTLSVRVADGQHALGYDSNLEYRLAPTVDSAGPQVTTWQGGDTLRMLLPWPRGISARWLLFFFKYSATTYAGETSDCWAAIRSDTLKFSRS